MYSYLSIGKKSRFYLFCMFVVFHFYKKHLQYEKVYIFKVRVGKLANKIIFPYSKIKGVKIINNN